MKTARNKRKTLVISQRTSHSFVTVIFSLVRVVRAPGVLARAYLARHPYFWKNPGP